MNYKYNRKYIYQKIFSIILKYYLIFFTISIYLFNISLNINYVILKDKKQIIVYLKIQRRGFN